MAMKIKFENVTFYYNHKFPTPKLVLKNINFEVNGSEFIGIIGPSGSGKTTLVQHFTGLLQPTAGKISVDGIDIASKAFDLDSIRKKIGIVFQFPEMQLFEETIYDDIAFGPKNFGLAGDELAERIKSTFDLVGIDIEKMRDRSPFKLSEGEKRRVALAGIIAMNPDIYILDEPTACLDAIGVHKIERLLTNLYDLGKAIVVVSHNLDFILKLCQRIIVLNNGNIDFDGSTAMLLKDEQILNHLNMSLPRTIRYSKQLFKLGYVDVNNLYSVEKIKSFLSA